MYIFIINPLAGNGRARRVFKKIRQTELYNSIKSDYYFTEYRGHAIKIAHQLKDKYAINMIKAVIIIGGDGTIHEVINGLTDDNIPVAFIPGGSGNDFARGSLISGKPNDILKRIISGKSKSIYWLGNYKLNKEIERQFVNSIGFGFDADIAKTANKSYYKKILNKLRLGTVSYLIALIQVLIRFKPFKVELEVDGFKRIVTDCWMITVTNHAYYGGGMKIVPNAKVQPARFPVLLIHSISKWKILALFMTVFSGKHIDFKEVELTEATKLTIKTDSEVFYQVDGETGKCSSGIITKQSAPIDILGINNRKK